MKIDKKDTIIIKKIQEYCTEVEDAHRMFQCSIENFTK